MPHMRFASVILVACLSFPPCGVAGSNATTRLQPLSLVHLFLKGDAWLDKAPDLIRLIQPLEADLMVIHGVAAPGREPLACQLAKPLRMHCDFITADPPSQKQRRGLLILSSRPLLDEGVTLLHGGEGYRPSAAGRLQIAINHAPLSVYAATLGENGAKRRAVQQQTDDLRHWMTSYPAGASLVMASTGTTSWAPVLIPGWRVLQAPRHAAVRDQDVDGLVLYVPAGVMDHSARRLTLEGVGASGQDLDVGQHVRLEMRLETSPEDAGVSSLS